MTCGSVHGYFRFVPRGVGAVLADGARPAVPRAARSLAPRPRAAAERRAPRAPLSARRGAVKKRPKRGQSRGPFQENFVPSPEVMAG